MSRDLLSGDLDFIELGEILQLIGMTGKSGVLCINSPWSDSEGQIEFSDGTPVDASDGEKTGLDALYALFGWKGGRFHFSNQHHPGERRINQDRMSVIMNAVRLLDEGKIKILGPENEVSMASSNRKPNASDTLKLPLIRGDSPDYTDIVDEERYTDGQPIFMEGKFGRWVYVILDGKADVVKKTPEGNTQLLRLGSGTYPGSILFFTDEKARSTSLLASGPVHLGVLDIERLYSEFSGKSPEFQSLATGMARRLKKMTDTAVRYSGGEQLFSSNFLEKEPLALPGMGNDQVMIIKGGEGHLIVDQGEHFIPLADLEAGDVIGDLSFLDSALKLTGACVFGDSDIELLKPDTRKLAEEYNQCSAALAAMIKNLVVRTLVTGMLACRYYDKMLAE